MDAKTRQELDSYITRSDDDTIAEIVGVHGKMLSISGNADGTIVARPLPMEVKLLIIHDTGTRIKCIALRPTGYHSILQSAGYGYEPQEYIFLTALDGGTGIITTDPFRQTNHTMRVAHMVLYDQWQNIYDEDDIWVRDYMDNDRQYTGWYGTGHMPNRCIRESDEDGEITGWNCPPECPVEARG